MSYQREYSERLRVAVVGVGSHAYRNILPSLNYLPVELVAVCDIDGGLAERTARQYGCRWYDDFAALLSAEHLEAVFLCVSGAKHPEFAIGAMKAGINVWMEKPPALAAERVRAMQESRGECVCMVGFKKAFMPATQKLQEIVGGPDGVHSLLGVYGISVPSPQDEDAEEGRWFADGCHPLALLTAVAGPACSIQTIRGKRGGGTCVIEFASGAIGNLHLADEVPLSQPFERYAAFGQGFSVTIDNSTRVVYQRGVEFEYGISTSFAPPGLSGGATVWEAQNSLNTLENKAEVVQGLLGSMKTFCECIQHGRLPSTGSLDHALETMELVEAAVKSDGIAIAIGASR
jgi:predicted dehydrogenase